MIFDKVKELFGGNYDDDDYDDDDEYEYDSPSRSDRGSDYQSSRPSLRSVSSSKRSDSQVVSINTKVQMEVCIIKPTCYEDAQEICDQIKSRKPVVVNLEKVEYPTAQRIMDFLSGTCYSLNGTIQRVANNIFVIAPENVDVSGDFKEELKTKGVILPWVSQGGK
ncbi:MAG: cell division protein SepF [Clostridia bacterium]|nr:cell division protein SepF [Clostridia bacterium]MCI1959109.1 cell division protein SepF [Clostridia bacterium]MCI2001022.1 cell division protein SepF [Clostridia bacterium]MCI2015621.1 cell division protein SepF [Clostridia bacterium]